ncbi:cytochrome c [Maritimibacter sp. HL-12]|uniref:c-type cytochrome n=1 Tax=Maritimibacter sp. HL-12 TaxID=1162418 RepID=UPI000A0F03A5|nr:c-type cytochrome [Maritimibacter sp. HL-12]SMH47245.1 Cytochrome c553 [Maritimibacter sp. HL-12]
MQPIKTTALAALMALAASAATAASDEELRAGKGVYMTKTCLACHGREGAKPVLSYPMLAGQNEAYLIEQMEVIRDGERVGTTDPATGHPYVTGMVDIMHLLSEDDINNVSAWLASLPAAPPKPLDPAPSAELLEAGEKAYRQLGCRSCHGPDGSRPSNKRYPFISGMNPEYAARAMTEIRDKVRTSGQSKLMFGTIRKADDEEILAMATWLATIDRSEK